MSDFGWWLARLRAQPAQTIEHRMTGQAPRSTAIRVQALRAAAVDLEAEIADLVEAMAPELLQLVGVDPINAAQVLVRWSHPGRFRSEAAFAAFAGTAPIPASSGLTTRHRLNRSGDRHLNRALHTIVLVRTHVDPTTRAYIQRRPSEGRTPREARRCLNALSHARYSSSWRTDPPTTSPARKSSNQRLDRYSSLGQ
ncbi:transposase [Spirillospora sp. CA-128828]|uniref:transposase n=1 Tax=Spirillospora sp. CA-128828 TaxID=3240033 RepID=UPI003D8DAC62